MATFTPIIPTTQDPSWLQQSHPISDVKADITASTAIKGLGDLFGLGVKTVDTLQKIDIDKQSEAGYDELTNRRIAGLEAAKAGGNVNDIVPPSEDVPSDVTGAVDRAQTLVSARKNGKISDSDYRSEMDKLASGIRTQYPGQRDYIDKKMAELTGLGTPANKKMQALVADLNAMAGAANSTQNKIQTMLKEMAGSPGAKALNAYVQSSSDSLEAKYKKVYEAYSDDSALKWRVNQKNYQRQEKDLGTKDDVDAADSSWTDYTKTSYINTVKNLTSVLLSKTEDPHLKQLIKDISEGKPVTANPDDLNTIGMLVHHVGEEHLTEMKKQAYANGWTKTLGTTRVDNDLNDFKGFWKSWEYKIYNKDFGYALVMPKQLEAMTINDSFDLMTKSPVKDTMRRLMAISGGRSPELVRVISDRLTDHKFFNGVGAWLNEETLKAADPSADKGTSNLYRSTRTLRERGVTRSDPYKELLSIAGLSTNPKVSEEERASTLEYLYNPKTKDLLTDGTFAKEGKDKDGKPVLGRMEMYRKLTTDAVTSEVASQSEKKPELKTMYLNFVLGGFRDMYRDELAELQKSVLNKNLKVRYTNTDQGVRFDIDPPPGFLDRPAPGTVRSVGDMQNPDYHSYLQAKEAFDRLNAGLGPLKNVGTKFGYDVDTFLMNSMYQMTNGQIPRQMLDAIISSRGETGTEEGKKMLRSGTSGRKLD